MNEWTKDLRNIHDPKNIKEALYASGPSVLQRAFEKDPGVTRLLRAGSKVAPAISAELEKEGLKLNPITLACFAYILQRTDPALAAKVLGPLFLKSLQQPDPYFMYFAAHALRPQMNLPSRPDDPDYTFEQLQETAAGVERRNREQKG